MGSRLVLARNPIALRFSRGDPDPLSSTLDPRIVLPYRLQTKSIISVNLLGDGNGLIPIENQLKGIYGSTKMGTMRISSTSLAILTGTHSQMKTLIYIPKT